MSQSFIINLLGGAVWEQHPVDTFRGNGHHMPLPAYAQHRGAPVAEGWDGAAGLRVPLWKTAKLDRFAYAHAETHACARSVNLSLFWRGNALFVPGHLVKNTNSWLVAEPGDGNKSQRGRYRQPTPARRARYHLFTLYGGIRVPFFNRGAISGGFLTASLQESWWTWGLATQPINDSTISSQSWWTTTRWSGSQPCLSVAASCVVFPCPGCFQLLEVAFVGCWIDERGNFISY